MMEKEYLSLEQVKKCELNILLYINSICKEYNLRYYLSFGTLIGAIRHKGFIPWDDDIDISMPREDYERLIDIAGILLNQRYKILSYTTKGYPYPFIKVVDSCTRIEDDGVVNYPHKGLWIDIFPIDGFKSAKRPLVSKFTIYIERLRSLASYRHLPSKHKKYSFMWCVARIIGYRFFQLLIEKLSKNRGFDDYDYSGCLYAPLKIMPKGVYGQGRFAEFEGHNFPVPSEFDLFLKEVYGDYMKLPPKEEQVSHLVKAYYVND